MRLRREEMKDWASWNSLLYCTTVERKWKSERKGALENVPEAMASIACLGNSPVMRLY